MFVLISADTKEARWRFCKSESEVDKGAHPQVYTKFRDWEYPVKTSGGAGGEREDCRAEHWDWET